MDEIRISIPGARAFGPVAGLVLGGVAARHELTLDVLDDLQLAIESLLERDDDEREVTIVLRVGADSIETSVGPFEREALAELDGDAGDGVGLRRLLDTVVDEVSVSERDGGSWVDLRKGYELAGSR